MSDGRMGAGAEETVVISALARRKAVSACNCQEFIRTEGSAGDRDKYHTVSITFTKAHLILTLGTGRGLQILQNIVNAVVSNFERREQQQRPLLPPPEMIRSLELCRGIKKRDCILAAGRIEIFNEGCTLGEVCGAFFDSFTSVRNV